MKNTRLGFSIVELLVAVFLSTMVLVGVMNISSTAVKNQMEGARRGAVTGWSLVSFEKMTKEIQGASVIVTPNTGSPTGNRLVGCNNWSFNQQAYCGAAADKRLNCAMPVEVFYYCYNPVEKSIWRYFTNSVASPGLTCPTAPPVVPCDGTGPFAQRLQIAWKAELVAPVNGPMFRRNDVNGTIGMHYAVGEQIPTVERPLPIFIPFNLALTAQRGYLNSAD
ncbi:MAG: prepilin-type N-terminal cleavage/methylation domain-containing protein [Elusimicrobiota bacterium]